MKRSGAGSKGRGKKIPAAVTSRRRRAPVTVDDSDNNDDDDGEYDDRNNDPDYVDTGSYNKRRRVAETSSDVYSLTVNKPTYFADEIIC